MGKYFSNNTRRYWVPWITKEKKNLLWNPVPHLLQQLQSKQQTVTSLREHTAGTELLHTVWECRDSTAAPEVCWLFTIPMRPLGSDRPKINAHTEMVTAALLLWMRDTWEERYQLLNDWVDGMSRTMHRIWTRHRKECKVKHATWKNPNTAEWKELDTSVNTRRAHLDRARRTSNMEWRPEAFLFCMMKTLQNYKVVLYSIEYAKTPEVNPFLKHLKQKTVNFMEWELHQFNKETGLCEKKTLYIQKHKNIYALPFHRLGLQVQRGQST